MRGLGAALVLGALALGVVVVAAGCAPVAPSPGPPDRPVEVTVYFADPQGMGLVGLQRRVPAGQAAEGIVRALIAGPRAGEPAVTPLPPGARLLGIALEDGLATVNFSRELRDNFGGGSAGETMLVYSLVNSLTGLPKVRAVRLEVEGEPLSTLGHLDLTGPLLRRPELIGPP